MDGDIIDRSQIKISEYETIGPIGHGGFGSVFKVKKKDGEDGNSYYAAKVIENKDEEISNVLDREVDIMNFANHRTIIKLIGYSLKDFHNEDNITIIMEYAENGSLFDIFDQVQRGVSPDFYNSTEKQIIMAGIARGMQYLHSHNIMHRDLKDQNILLDKDHYPLITDFGLSKYFLEGRSKLQTKHAGTLIYEAPEILNNANYGKNVDVYAFGILLYQIVTDSFPYPDFLKKEIPEYKLIDLIVNHDYRPKFEIEYNKNLQKLIQQCWDSNPEKRPTFNEIFEKLSNFNPDSQYLIDENVDLNEFEDYIKIITEVDVISENKLERVLAIKNTNNYLKNENKNLKNANKELLDTKEKNIKNLNHILNTTTVLDYNSYPLFFKQQLSEELTKSSIDETNKFFSKMNELIIFLLQFDQIANSIIEIIEDKEKLLKDIDENCFILLQSKLVHYVITNEIINSVKFKNIIKKFQHVVLELEYPSDSFDDIYNKALEFRKSAPDKINISILVTAEKSSELVLHNDNNIKYIKLSPNVKSICSFDNCTLLEQVTLSNSLIEIPENAFNSCSSLQEISIPSSVTKIGDNAFNKCLLIQKIYVPSSVTEIGKGSFFGCSSLEEISISPFSSITVINENSFQACSSLTNIILPLSVKTIESKAFYNCYLLSQITIPSSVQIIGPKAFFKCVCLKQIEIPSSVTEIGMNAFSKCLALEQITFNENSNLTLIGEGCFSECSLLTQITIPSKISEIREGTFKGCSSLKIVIIPSSVKSINECAFDLCLSLEKINFPTSITSIKDGAFLGCNLLSSIILPFGLKEIGIGAFCNCSSLKNVVIPFCLTRIPENAFAYCSSLQNLKIPSSIKEIGKLSFYCCTSLVDISIPSSVCQIEENAFSGCSALKKVTIHSKNTLIDKNAFIECPSLMQFSKAFK